MDLKVRQAALCEAEAVISFYHEMINALDGAKYHPKWRIGVYPDDEYLYNAVTDGQMFIAEADGVTVGAMIVNGHASDGYATAHWKVDAKGGEFCVIHTLGVLPSYSKLGIGTAMVRAAIENARADGKKSVRLDVLCGNLPAEILYRRNGFEYIETVTLFYEVTGRVGFDLYEYVL